MCLAAAALFVTACLPMRAPDPAPRPLDRDSLGAVSSTGLAGRSISTVEASEEDLARFIREVIERNPGLQASWLEYEAALQRVPQVTSLSEPMLTGMVGIEHVQTRTGEQDFGLGLEQRFPWFDVLDLRGQVAAVQAEEAQFAHHSQMLDLVRRTQGLWWETAFQRRARLIAEEEQQLLQHWAEIATSRYSTDVGSQQDVLRAEVEVSRIQETLIGIERRLRTMTAELNTLADHDANSVITVQPLDESDSDPLSLDIETLIASAEALRPELQGLRQRLDRHARERALARREYMPEFTIGVNWISVGDVPVDLPSRPPDEGKDVVMLNGGITIPLWWRAYRAAVAEAERNIEATTLRIDDMENRIVSEVLSAHFAMTEAQDLIELYESALIPQAEQSLAAIESAYSTGQTSMIDLFDAERTLLRIRLALAQAHRDQKLAMADLERAVGAALVTPAANFHEILEVTDP
jgi:outer membrane protein TolC